MRRRLLGLDSGILSSLLLLTSVALLSLLQAGSGGGAGESAPFA
ncbi:MAG: hypothetical protein ACE5JX_00955 [Acidobacteriota bacterium]